jgi:hypothetical protein
MKRLGLAIVVASCVLVGACGSGTSTEGGISATIGGVAWHAPGQGYVVAGSDGTTSFDLLSRMLTPSSPRLQIIFPGGIPSVGSHVIDGVALNVEYQVDTNTLYAGENGSVQIVSLSQSRAQGAFNFVLTSPIDSPMTLTVTDGAFDVPLSGP